MRYSFYTVCVLFSIVVDSYSQCQNGILQTEVYAEIGNNHRRNNAFSYGMISYQSHADNFYYENFDNPAFYLGFGKSMWIAAKDQDENLYVSANTFPYLARHDFIPGPLDRDTGMPIDSFCDTYNRVWVVKEIDVFQMQLRFQSGNLAIEDIPLDILQWPAKGNPHLGDQAPDFDMAPFADIAEDGIYDPLTGDYPVAIEESSYVPHEFSFIVYNDRSAQRETRGLSMGVELQQVNYVVNCSDDSPSEHSVFTRIKYTYLGDKPMSEFKMALWEDNDMACNQNDYEGVSQELNATYFYNESGRTFLDECHDPDVPDNNGAIRSTIFFDHTIKTYKHWYLLGVGDTLVQGIDPAGDLEYYRYMVGQWRDGEPMTRGGNGYNPGSTDTTLFVFPDLPTDTDGWSMQTARIDLPVDVRALSTLVDDREVTKGYTGVINFADYFLYDKTKKELEIFEVWPNKVNELKADYQNITQGQFDCGATLELCTENCVWPGDSNNDSVVDGKDFLLSGLYAGYRSEGPPRNFISSDWFAFAADDWQDELDDVNAKYSDGNGDGRVDISDLDVIASNFGNFREDISPTYQIANRDSLGLNNTFEIDSLEVSGANIFDRIVETRFALGDNSSVIAEPLYGINYIVQFDTNLVAPFIKLDDNYSSLFDYSHGYMSMGVTEGNVFSGNNKIEYTVTNTDGRAIFEGGTLNNQNFYVKENAVTNNPDGRDTLVLRYLNVCAVNERAMTVPLGAYSDSLILTGLLVDTSLVSSVLSDANSLHFALYPNPAQELINIIVKNQDRTGKVAIYDAYGNIMQRLDRIQEGENTIDISNYQVGIYIVTYVDTSGDRTSLKFVKI